MTKNTLSTIYTALTGNGTNTPEAIAEAIAAVEKEMNKTATIKAKNAEAYDAIHDIVISALADEPATCGEIFDAIEDELPEGITRSKVQYALSHLWKDEIVKIEGKPNTYRKA